VTWLSIVEEPSNTTIQSVPTSIVHHALVVIIVTHTATNSLGGISVRQ
jgi:hypothetical protein